MDNLLKKRLALIKSRAKQLAQPHRPHRPATVGVEPLALAGAAPGTERVVEGERFYLIHVTGGAIAADAPSVAERFLKISERRTWPLISLIQDPGPDMATRIRNDEICFLDIETTGLSPSTYVFLCGLMYVEDRRFVVEQLFARDYSEEKGMLLHLRDVVGRYPMIVTFNGSGFDVPFLRIRMAVTRVEAVTPFEHVDLFDTAKEHFADVLADCKLETIERHLRGFKRRGDISGWEIPQAYHEFVRTGDAGDIRRILYHNRMDLLAMAYLVNYLADRHR
ncbi:MAG: ribonuclease H-like domain-containing protein, partial [Candidatus Krumholzibacteria bacterium]|nr:ribonuclease H-like domain-containing protein [Candidatus Krumholzibacteria bacterium]